MNLGLGVLRRRGPELRRWRNLLARKAGTGNTQVNLRLQLGAFDFDS
jgi:hypothetical protein